MSVPGFGTGGTLGYLLTQQGANGAPVPWHEYAVNTSIGTLIATAILLFLYGIYQLGQSEDKARKKK